MFNEFLISTAELPDNKRALVAEADEESETTSPSVKGNAP